MSAIACGCCWPSSLWQARMLRPLWPVQRHLASAIDQILSLSCMVEICVACSLLLFKRQLGVLGFHPDVLTVHSSARRLLGYLSFKTWSGIELYAAAGLLPGQYEWMMRSKAKQLCAKAMIWVLFGFGAANMSSMVYLAAPCFPQ